MAHTFEINKCMCSFIWKSSIHLQILLTPILLMVICHKRKLQLHISLRMRRIQITLTQIRTDIIGMFLFYSLTFEYVYC